MIKTLIKLKILKFAIISGVSVAYTFKRICDQKKLSKKEENSIKKLSYD